MTNQTHKTIAVQGHGTAIVLSIGTFFKFLATSKKEREAKVFVPIHNKVKNWRLKNILYGRLKEFTR